MLMSRSARVNAFRVPVPGVSVRVIEEKTDCFSCPKDADKHSVFNDYPDRFLGYQGIFVAMPAKVFMARLADIKKILK